MPSDVIATKLVLHITPSTNVDAIVGAEHGVVADIFDAHGNMAHRPVHLTEKIHPANVFFRIRAGPKMKGQFSEMAKLGCMGFDNFGVLLSGIRDNNDLYHARMCAQESGLNFGNHTPFGTMVEYPSLAMLHEEIANNGPTCMVADIDALSVRMLGALPDSDGIHPSVMKIIEGMKEECRKGGVSLGASGRCLKSREALVDLVRAGIDFLVVAPEDAPGARRYALHAEKARELDFLKAKIRMQLKARSI